jgi:hypothetical protein
MHIRDQYFCTFLDCSSGLTAVTNVICSRYSKAFLIFKLSPRPTGAHRMHLLSLQTTAKSLGSPNKRETLVFASNKMLGRNWFARTDCCSLLHHKKIISRKPVALDGSWGTHSAGWRWSVGCLCSLAGLHWEGDATSTSGEWCSAGNWPILCWNIVSVAPLSHAKIYKILNRWEGEREREEEYDAGFLLVCGKGEEGSWSSKLRIILGHGAYCIATE